MDKFKIFFISSSCFCPPLFKQFLLQFCFLTKSNRKWAIFRVSNSNIPISKIVWIFPKRFKLEAGHLGHSSCYGLWYTISRSNSIMFDFEPHFSIIDIDHFCPHLHVDRIEYAISVSWKNSGIIRNKRLFK